MSGEGHSGPYNLTLLHRCGQRPSLNCGLCNKDLCGNLQGEKKVAYAKKKRKLLVPFGEGRG